MTEQQKRVEDLRQSASASIKRLPRTRDDVRVAFVKPAYIDAIDRAAEAAAKEQEPAPHN